MKNLIYLVAFNFFLNCGTYAQEKIKEIPLKNTQGTAIGYDNESIEQILQRAVNETKLETLKKSGFFGKNDN